MIKDFFEKQKLKKIKVFLKKKVNFKKAEFEGSNKIGANTNIRKSKIGFGTYIGNNCMLSTCYIGRYCSLGNEIKIIVGNHPTNYVSTHPFCYSSAFEKEGLLFSNIIKFDDVSIVEKGKDIEIGNDVWIGDNVIILGGVKIGNGAVIGAGALVTKDVIPYSIVVGVPARVIKMRFEKKHIEMLEEFKWWNKDREWLSQNIDKFSDIHKFEKIIKNKN